MDCLDVKEALSRGAPLSAQAAAHASTCPVCAGSLDAPDPAAESLFTSIQREVVRERGVRAWLRERSTPVRWIFAIVAAAVLAALTAWVLPRGAYGPWPLRRLALDVATLAVGLAVLVRLGLAPLQAPPASRGRMIAALSAGLVLPFVFAYLPVPFEARVDALPGISDTRATLGCLAIGVVDGALLVVVFRLLDRGVHGSLARVLFAAVAGGLAGNIALELHCPITRTDHLVLGHAMVGVLLVVTYGVLAAARTARAR